jgi:hypothetical protein
MGIRKVDLSALAGELSHKGRSRFMDDELLSALRDAIDNGGDLFVWETAKVTGKTETERDASRAKWRNRATSVFAQLPEDTTSAYKVKVQWTKTNDEMVLTVYPR